MRHVGSDAGLAIDLFSGLYVGQSSLLGIWFGLGTSRHWKRLVGGIIGIGIIYLDFVVSSGGSDMVQLIAPGTYAAFVASPLLFARACRIVIQVDSSSTCMANRLYFSSRDLLMLTFVVAVMIALGKVFHSFILVWLSASHFVFIAALLILCGVVTVWLILATKRPVAFGVGLIVMSACSGYFLALSSTIDGSASGMTAFTTTSISVVVVSLLAVRSCGYRLVRLPKSTPQGSRPAEFTKPEISSPDSQSSSLSP
jgi:hypothetical protein